MSETDRIVNAIDQLRNSIDNVWILIAIMAPFVIFFCLQRGCN